LCQKKKTKNLEVFSKRLSTDQAKLPPKIAPARTPTIRNQKRELEKV
jgi:hypothetical protein